MTDDPISRIEAALAAGPTQGPWRTWIVGDAPERLAVTDADGLSVLTVVHEADNASFAACYLDADARYIAACNPTAIRALLDRLKAAEQRAEYWKAAHLAGNAEIERLRNELAVAADALREAADEISGWASYASDYFREKHDLEGDLKRTRDAAEHFRALLAKRGGK